jgi:integrase
MNITVFAKSEDSKGFVRLYLYRSIRNVPGWFPTKIKVIAGSWDQDKQMLTSKQFDHKKLQSLLIKRIGQLNQVFQDLEYEGIPPAVPVVRARYNAFINNRTMRQGVRQLSLLEYIDQYREDRKKIRSDKGYLRKFKPMKAHLIKFNPAVDFKDMTNAFYNEWLTYLYEDKELESNTVSGYVKKLKSVLKAAVLDPRTKLQNIPTDFLLWKDTYVKPKPFYLDWETDVRALENQKVLSEDLPVKQFFLFQCYTGLRHTDLFNIRPQNFIYKDGKVFMDFMGMKTKADQHLQLNNKAVSILKEWKGNPPRLQQSICNDRIKIICRAAGITSVMEKVRYAGSERKVSLLPKWKLVTTHAARRTFGRRWMENGGQLRNLMVYYGHSNERQTAEYIGWTTQEVNEEMMKVMI